MKKETYEFSVYLGRYQPFHSGHQKVLGQALQVADKVIIFLGSHNKAPDIKDPFNSTVRKDMILSCNRENASRLIFCPIRDQLYSDNNWLIDVQKQIAEQTNDSENITLMASGSDATSYYLDLLPDLHKTYVPNHSEFKHATEIRNMYFTENLEYKKYVPDEVAKYLEDFRHTNYFRALKEEFDYLTAYMKQYESMPYPPIFVTVDCIVICSQHVLLTRRAGYPGKGLFALPGGFLKQDERILTGALRELKEETGIKVPKQELEKNIVDTFTADYVWRSTRGRTISHVFTINLGGGQLPHIRAGSDAEKVFWMSIPDVLEASSSMYEDHFHLLGRAIRRY